MKLLDGILELVKANIAPSIPCYDLKGQMEIDEEKNKTEDLMVVLQEGLLRSVLLECFTIISLKIFTVQNSAHSVRLFPIQSERRF